MMHLNLLSLPNDLLRECHHHLILLLTQGFDPAKYPHITLKLYELLLLNFPNLLILQHIGFHVLDTRFVLSYLLLEGFILLLD